MLLEMPPSLSRRGRKCTGAGVLLHQHDRSSRRPSTSATLNLGRVKHPCLIYERDPRIAGRAAERWPAAAARRTTAPARPGLLMTPPGPARQSGPAPSARSPSAQPGRPAHPPRRPARRRSAGTGAAAADPAAARPASTPRPGPRRPAGSGSGTACPTSARSVYLCRSGISVRPRGRSGTCRCIPVVSCRKSSCRWGTPTYRRRACPGPGTRSAARPGRCRPRMSSAYPRRRR